MLMLNIKDVTLCILKTSLIFSINSRKLFILHIFEVFMNLMLNDGNTLLTTTFSGPCVGVLAFFRLSNGSRTVKLKTSSNSYGVKGRGPSWLKPSRLTVGNRK